MKTQRKEELLFELFLFDIILILLIDKIDDFYF